MTADRFELFLPCAPGIEAMLAEEVRELLGADGREVAGGVELDGGRELVYRANLELGLAARVLVRLGGFEARSFAVLVDRAAGLPWEDWLAPGQAVAMRVSARKSRLYHTGAIAERVTAAIERRLGAAPAPGTADADATVHVRMAEDLCTLSIDASGEPLHRRGYRLATAKAPLREDLARALVIASGWDRSGPLVDPFCGSGTILIEAGLLARGVPPGGLRRFAFMDAPGFDQRTWQRVRDRAQAAARSAGPRLIGSDRDSGAIGAATDNAARAAVAVELAVAPVGRAPALIEPPAAAGAVVSNPPYGERIGRGRDLRPLYQTLGARIAALPGRWRVALLVADRRLAGQTGLELASTLMTEHGGRKVFMMTGEHLHAG